MAEEPRTFQAAMEELEVILHKLDSEEVNIDSLTIDLQRASELIEWCRSRLETTRVDVERIVADLDEN
ncbi:MAG: exodeoxyribonuclease VII small subunit [Actinomycetota bacterium]|jgi:exodeoxyribonuclease VII small subunit|nr:exodeoxyribonuclease VII small subunit [Acidimicrobiales bacterium]MEC7875035.1 exodeoxyribonuclease VII small subunit [Actinomycetota bacterium]MCS5681370.1 exodeoxyribonuclease VII small subunit [Acidimicrobiales bacterium]MEC8829408.1 exodeoxyribonuclease VII small subunit [Actinomycetota bacterium]MEC8975667.1 exodeoxyribonuclease VII small subunit [Actinomycetota bacterium]|tara:strand:+ start:1445 stop:1648 length:204 start_codon:yes stop_codon:yes gene_type:complete